MFHGLSAKTYKPCSRQTKLYGSRPNRPTQSSQKIALITIKMFLVKIICKQYLSYQQSNISLKMDR